MRTITLLVSMLLAIPGSACACSCLARSGDIELETTKAESAAYAVVLAKASKVVNYQVDHSPYGKLESQKVDWVTSRAWKGPYKFGSSFQTDTLVACCLCGMEVELGVSYLLYLERAPPHTLSSCSLSLPEVNAAEYIRVLDAAKVKVFEIEL